MDQVVEAMTRLARQKRPLMLVLGSFSAPSLGDAVCRSRSICEQIEREERYFPIDVTGLYNSWQSRIPLPMAVWARYLGTLARSSRAVMVIGSGHLSDAVIGACRECHPGTEFLSHPEAPTVPTMARAVRNAGELQWQVLDAIKNPKPLCYVAGPYSWNPAVCVGRIFARATLLLKDYCPVLPIVSHDLDCAKPRLYERWLEFDAHLLGACECICRGPGTSRGADAEEVVARSLGLRQVLDPPHHIQEFHWMEPALAILRRPEPESTEGY